MKTFFIKNERFLIFLLVMIFILIRLPGTGLPLHQDEYKWPIAVNPVQSAVIIPHPPLDELIYRTAGFIVGFNTHFRFVPLFFGTLNLLLLYYLLRFLFGKKEALIGSFIWIFSFFSVLASLMVDTDGEIIPFFFLLSLIGYYKIRSSSGKKQIWWGVLLVLACICGFMIKVSFLLAIFAIVADFLWSKRNLLMGRDILKYFLYVMSGAVLLGFLLFLMKFIFPFFKLSASITYWEHFANFGNRGWFQTGIQCVKALLYSSPFLVLVPLLGMKVWSKETFSKIRLFLFFLFFSFIFYVILFDFSIGALDRYLQLLILPLTVLTTVTITLIWKKNNDQVKEFLLLGTVFGLWIVLCQFLPHHVPALQPKAEWLYRALSLRWNFVYPFSGGSGPLGFYVSFLFMALIWIVSLIALVLAYCQLRWRMALLIFLIPIGFFYNAVFIEEYLFGFWNGYAPSLVFHAAEFIKNDPDIKSVTVYNDNGGNEIMATGKYHRRLYVDPMFNINQKVAALNTDKEFYFVLDVPRLDPTSVYVKYFKSCPVVYQEIDKKMSATIYDCRSVPDVKI